MMETDTLAGLQPGDKVELRSIPAGRAKRLRIGMMGMVEVGSEGNEFAWCSVRFAPNGPLHLLATRHLRRVEDAE